MKRILVLGAGKSATALIDYLIEHATELSWQVIVADRDLSLAQAKVEGRPNAEALELDIMNEDSRAKEIQLADFVISMLPPFLHIHAARDCVQFKTDLVTASYVSDEIKALDAEAAQAGVLLMNEMGADPGIDHMSAMEIIEKIRSEGGEITSFQSYCGGLVAPESDNTPWHYKIAWNPWNIVRAGGGGADFLMNGNKFHRKYENLYKESNMVDVPGYGILSAYANRDSLKYIEAYSLVHAHTILRATLRHPDFVAGWAAVIALGLTDDKNEFEVDGLTFAQWFEQVTNKIDGNNLKEKLITIDADKRAFDLIEGLGVTKDISMNLSGTLPPAKVMQSIIEKEWKLSPEDKDLLVFHHDFEYELDGDSHQLESTMLVTGDNPTDTAMAKCVGLPMAIFTKLFLTQGFKNLTGVKIPIMKQVYEPVLAELKTRGVVFSEK